jgi:hypothetical protein
METGFLLILLAIGFLIQLVFCYLNNYRQDIRLRLLSQIDEQYLAHFRAQRHNFINDFQVVYGYIQLGRPEKALEYIKQSSRKSQEVGGLLRLSSPELSALFLHILAEAELKEIEVEFEFLEDLSDLSGNLEPIMYGYREAFSFGVEELSKDDRIDKTIYLRFVKNDDLYGILCEIGQINKFFPVSKPGWLRNKLFIWKTIITNKEKGQNLFEKL